MRRAAWAAIAYALFVVGGCAPTSQALHRALKAAPDCCDSVRDFNYQALDVGERRRVELNATSPAHQFATGKSYYAAFQLPPYHRPLTVRVRSFVSGGLALADAYLFYPMTAILGADYSLRSVVAVPPDQVESAVRDDFFAGIVWDLNVPVDEGDAYFVVYTDARRLGTTFTFERDTTLTRTLYYPGGSLLVTDPVHVEADIPFAAGGRLEVSLSTVGAGSDQ